MDKLKWKKLLGFNNSGMKSESNIFKYSMLSLSKILRKLEKNYKNYTKFVPKKKLFT